MQVCVVGNDDFATGFRLAGVRNIYISDEKSDEKVEEALENGDIGILVMEQEDYDKLSHRTRTKLEKLVTPVVVTVSRSGKETDLRSLIKRSVGVDLWK